MLPIAAHVLGKYVKYSDSGERQGRGDVLSGSGTYVVNDFLRVITDLGGKAKVMELMGHENSYMSFVSGTIFFPLRGCGSIFIFSSFGHDLD